MKNLLSRLKTEEQELLYSKDDGRRLMAVEVIGQLHQALRSLGLAGHFELSRSIDCMDNAFSDMISPMPGDVVMLACEYLPLSLDNLHVIGVMSDYDNAVVEAVARNIVNQQRYVDPKATSISSICSELMENGRCAAIIILLDGLLDSESPIEDSLGSEVKLVILNAVKKNAQMVVDWAVAHESTLTSDLWLDALVRRMNLAEALVLFHAGLEDLGRIMMPILIREAKGLELYQMEQAIGPSAIRDEFVAANRSGYLRTDHVALIAYLLTCAELPEGWLELRNEFTSNEVEIALQLTQEHNVDRRRFVEVLCKVVGNFNKNTCWTLSFIQKLEKAHPFLPKDFTEMVMNAALIRHCDHLTSLVGLTTSALHRHVKLDGSSVQDRIDATVREQLVTHHTPGVVELVNSEAFRRLVAHDVLIASLDAHFRPLKEDDKDYVLSNVPLEIRNQCPSMKRRVLEVDLDL